MRAAQSIRRNFRRNSAHSPTHAPPLLHRYKASALCGFCINTSDPELVAEYNAVVSASNAQGGQKETAFFDPLLALNGAISVIEEAPPAHGRETKPGWEANGKSNPYRGKLARGQPMPMAAAQPPRVTLRLQGHSPPLALAAGTRQPGLADAVGVLVDAAVATADADDPEAAVLAQIRALRYRRQGKRERAAALQRQVDALEREAQAIEQEEAAAEAELERRKRRRLSAERGTSFRPLLEVAGAADAHHADARQDYNFSPTACSDFSGAGGEDPAQEPPQEPAQDESPNKAHLEDEISQYLTCGDVMPSEAGDHHASTTGAQAGAVTGDQQGVVVEADRLAQ